jgi:predicted nucleic acid-binding protein
MDKLKIYLDTSVISHLEAPDTPHQMADTKQLWEYIKAGKFEVYISNIALKEINACAEPKQSKLHEFLSEIEFTPILAADNRIKIIEDELISQKILTEKSRDDCTHIANALTAGCDIILSWNFKHMVNVKTINGIRKLNASKGRQVYIYTPGMFIEMLGDDTDE